jgi:hypothetical protein
VFLRFKAIGRKKFFNTSVEERLRKKENTFLYLRFSLVELRDKVFIEIPNFSHNNKFV